MTQTRTYIHSCTWLAEHRSNEHV